MAAPCERVSKDPHIEIVRRFLLPEECAYLIRRANPLLTPSFVDDGKSGIGQPDPIRTSHGAAFVPHEADLVVQEVTGRIAELTGTSEANAEPFTSCATRRVSNIARTRMRCRG